MFDYFSDRICRQLIKMFVSWVRPGGLVSVTNVHPSNPNRHQMEHLLEWYLVYRDEAAIHAMAPTGCRVEVTPDATGVNIFMDMRKDD